MPLHHFRCCEGHVSEILVPLEHLKWQKCEHDGCTYMAYQIPSCPNFRINNGTIPVDDSSDPWEGTPLEGGGEPDVLRYRSDKIFLDNGKKTQPNGRAKPVDWGRRIAEAQPGR